MLIASSPSMIDATDFASRGCGSLGYSFDEIMSMPTRPSPWSS